VTRALEVRAIHKRFGEVHALAGVDLEVERGEFFALLGPNGAGKSTLINIIAGLARAASGEARVMGHDVVADYRQARRALGVVPQELVFDPFFTVRETLEIQSGYYGLRHNDAWIDALLDGLGLADKADTNMRRLSGGMKRRVLVAQALVHKPPVIILDEPTAGVDVELRQSLWQFIQNLNREGHTILLTTHYLEEAEALCNRIAMLKQGRIIALDTKENLLARFTEKYACFTLRAGSLPPALASRVKREGDRFRVRLTDMAELEQLLCTLRHHGAVIADLDLIKPDLEEVFIHIMQAN
jgi:ABC-2 type transport system ATP-binding protein